MTGHEHVSRLFRAVKLSSGRYLFLNDVDDEISSCSKEGFEALVLTWGDAQMRIFNAADACARLTNQEYQEEIEDLVQAVLLSSSFHVLNLWLCKGYAEKASPDELEDARRINGQFPPDDGGE